MDGPPEMSQQASDPVIEQVSSRVVYENRWMRVREDQIRRPDGSDGIYSVVDKPDFALVIPAQDDGFHLVEEYRYPIGRRSWAFPQGTFPTDQAGTPEQLARTELAQEAGLHAGRLVYLGFLHCSHGMSGQGLHAFLATDLKADAPDREHEEQDMRQRWFPRAEFERMILDGRVTDDSSVAAYTLLSFHERHSER